eukprot:SAG31_NODE_128_length_23532_cov_21.204754_14_plen_431_part_00
MAASEPEPSSATSSTMSLKGVTDEGVIAAAVAGAVWGLPDLDVQLEDKSGGGGGKVYFASAKDVTPGKVVVKILGENASFPLAQKRMEAGVEALRASGLIRPCLAVGPDWTAEAFAGDAVSAGGPFKFEETRAPPDALGKLLAKLHATPTQWYEPYREATINRDPKLAEMLRAVPDHSHAWQPVPWGLETGLACTGAGFPHPDAAKAMFDAMVDRGVFEMFFRNSAFYPKSSAGKRVVTNHGDFKADNVVHDPERDELVAIDFELISVGPAAMDLGFATVFWLGGNRSSPEYRRAFYDAYLGGDATDEIVKQTMLDAEVYAMMALGGPLSSVYDAQCVLLRGSDHYTASGSMRTKTGVTNDAPNGEESLRLLGEAIEEVRASDALTEEVVKNGLVATMCARKCGEEPLWAVLDELKEDGMLRLLGVHPSK